MKVLMRGIHLSLTDSLRDYVTRHLVDHIARYIDDEATSATLRSLIDTCRFNCTGNLYWSLRTGRYGIGQQSMAEGTVIQLK